MSCPTCDRTMQCAATGIFWCPRCGTIKTMHPVWDTDDDKAEVAVPALVRRVRELKRRWYEQHGDLEFTSWHTTGVDEATTLESERAGKTPGCA